MDTADRPAGGRTGRHRLWSAFRLVAGLGLAALALWVLYGHGGELQGHLLSHLEWWWLVPAVLAELAAYVSFAALQGRLLRAGGVAAPTGPLVSVTFASQSISNSLPGGPALAAVYGFRWYRRFGADEALAGWALVGVAVALSVSLAAVAGVGLVLAAEYGASLDLVWVVGAAVVASAVVAVLFVYERPLLWLVDGMVRAAQRLTGRPRPAMARRISDFVARAVSVPLGWRGMGATVGWGAGNWLLDCTCFALSFLVVGGGIPFKGLLLAYGAGQLAANLPITPGGLGAVEGSIVIALEYFGGSTHTDVAAVLVYRLISFWLALVVGWVLFGVLALGVRRGRYPRTLPDIPVAHGHADDPAGGRATAAVAPGGQP